MTKLFNFIKSKDIFLEWMFVELQHSLCVLRSFRMCVTSLLSGGKTLSVLKEIVTVNMDDQLKIFPRKRHNFTWISSPGSWCAFPSLPEFSSEYQFLFGSPTVPSKDGGYCPPESHKPPAINSYHLTWGGLFLYIKYCEGRLTLLSSKLSNGLWPTTHRKFSTASLGKKWGSNSQKAGGRFCCRDIHLLMRSLSDVRICRNVCRPSSLPFRNLFS